MKIRIIISAVFTVTAIGVLTSIVVQKERLLAHGDRVFLKLAPRDPRSLMQGDYMALRYSLAADLESILDKKKNDTRNGLAIITLDASGIAVKVRRYADWDRVRNNEKLIRFKIINGDISFGAESFFFQEGQGKSFEKARYGELALDDKGSSVLVGLRDENLNILKTE